MLCSVPPKASNYIQRVGRAGRKTGNALVLAFAATRPHDLYFFQAPLEAMAGTVQPPGCYLSAPEVLKRQAMAFAFDGYAKRGGTLPGRVGDLWNPGERKKFPEPVVEFIKPQREKLQSAFVEMFRNDNLNETARRYIAAYLTPEADGYSPLERALVTVTADTRTKREALRELVKKLTARELELKGETTEAKRQLELDDERHRVVDELKFTSQQLGAMGKKDLFGWLTEEGCLPNYAFPERGVKLDAFIRREGVGREPEHHEWVRAPANALTELAPFNTFYASSRRVTIDGIELKRSQKPVDWRFCRTCHYAEVATSVGEVGQACPSCGDAHFADVGLRRGVVTMGQVFAVAKHRDAVLGDDGDDRDRSFYERATLFSAQAKARDAWSNEAAGFGFELQDAMVMRELNLGKKQDKGTPQTFRLAGKDVPDVRFTLCEDCGQAHLPGPANHMFEKPRDKHRAWCPERKKPEEKQRFREVYLMRELKSEALRLVVPVSDSGDAGVDMANLKAALRLGLRRFYGGEPEFLQVAVYDEPLHEGEGKRRYLVVMDRVPGGTGLLTELALNKGRSLHEALTHASNMLRTCACQKREPAARACYQCLYAYREQESLPFLERARALELVDTLIDAFASLKKVDSIGTMDQSQVLESELEHRFHARLIDEIRSDGGRVEEANESTWKITYGGRGWLLRAQVELDRSQVEVPSRADFILYPEPLDSDPKGTKLRPIAIYTDGLAYHVCPSQAQARLGMDARQREAIAATDTMLSWSLSWKDVVSPKDPPVPTWLGDGTQYTAFVSLVQQVATVRKAPEWNHLLRVLDSDPLKGLLAVMKAPLGLTTVAQLAAFILLQKGRRKTATQSYEDMIAICDNAELPSSTAHLPSEGDIATRELVLGEFAHLRMSIPNGELNGLLQKTGNLQVALRLEDQAEHRRQPAFESSWRQWLRAWNLLQALPGARMVTQEAIAKRVEADVPVRAMTPVEAPVRNEKALHDLLRNLDVEDLKRVLAELLTKHPGKPLPTIPFELRRPAWRVEDDVEVAFEGERVALYLDAQQKGADALKEAKWKIVAIDRGMDLKALKDVLGWSEG